LSRCGGSDTLRPVTPPPAAVSPPESFPAGRPLDPDVAAGRGAARLARTLENVLATVDLSLPQYRMLAFLDDMGSTAASALAGRLGVSRPSVTALIDGLVARGMAERTADPRDRRRVAHVITATGQAALAAADAAVTDRLASLSDKVESAEEREVAYRGLAIWLGALNAEREAKLADP
jgi:long-chain acyl-CoA synthetase